MANAPNKPKPTKAAIEQRTHEILRIRLDGAEIWDVREYVREKEAEEGSPWQLPDGQKPLSDSQLWRYISRADKLIAESCRASEKKLLRRHLAQRRNLYAKALSQGDIRAALACIDSEAKLIGLFDKDLRELRKTLADVEKKLTALTPREPPGDLTRASHVVNSLAAFAEKFEEPSASAVPPPKE